MGRASHQSFCESVRGCICAWGGTGDGGGAARGLTSRRARSGPSGPSVAAEGLRNVASRQVSAAPRAGVRCWFMYAGAGRSSRTGPAPRWMCAPLDTGPDHRRGRASNASKRGKAPRRSGRGRAAHLPGGARAAAAHARRACAAKGGGASARSPDAAEVCAPTCRPSATGVGLLGGFVGRRSGCWADRPGCLWPRPVNGSGHGGGPARSAWPGVRWCRAEVGGGPEGLGGTLVQGLFDSGADGFPHGRV